MYIFYDTETSGLNKAFSQVLQIGMMYTDDDMNILSSKKVDCRRSPWTVPSPGSMLITHFTPDQLKNAKMSHYEMMQETDKWARSQYQPVLFSGFNTVGFDESIMAHNLHQALLDPKLTTGRNAANGQQNGVFDINQVLRATVVYMPGALKLDIKNEKGQPSLSLLNVAIQNGVTFNQDDAHDALNDVRATVGLAKVLKQTVPHIWDHMLSLARAEGVEDFMKKNKMFTQGWYAFGRKGGNVVTSVATRAGDSREILFDLAVDPAPFMKMSVDELKEVFIEQGKKNQKTYQPKPFRSLNKDMQPMIMPMDQSEAILPAKFDEELAEARADAIKANAQFCQNVAQAAALAQDEMYPPYKNPQAEQTLHDYPEDQMKVKMQAWTEEFNQAPSWKDRATLVADFDTRFEEDLKIDPTLRSFVQFAERIVFEAAPEELSQERQDTLKTYIAEHVLSTDPKVPQMTIAKARQELEEIEAERAAGRPRWSEVTDTQIRSIKLYYTAIEKEYAPYLPPQVEQPAANDDTPPAAPAKPTQKAANDRFKPK